MDEREITMVVRFLHSFENGGPFMRRTFFMYGALLLLPVSLLVMGCSKSTAPNASSASSTQVSDAADDHATHDKGESTTQAKDAEIEAAMAKLPADDRALAVQQKICPVSGERLGEMGAPVKIDVKGQPVFICCEGCKDQLLAKPDEYLAKIKK
jgi:YHS domain-containing protein